MLASPSRILLSLTCGTLESATSALRIGAMWFIGGFLAYALFSCVMTMFRIDFIPFRLLSAIIHVTLWYPHPFSPMALTKTTNLRNLAPTRYVEGDFQEG
ncbi:hypothetical protein BJ165DRAFT_578240 [Panaeolus papilionaceus]|nr:hypothetical protein BJ165DRAFT_578240 [Panaeolus papilionaceus]